MGSVKLFQRAVVSVLLCVVVLGVSRGASCQTLDSAAERKQLSLQLDEVGTALRRDGLNEKSLTSLDNQADAIKSSSQECVAAGEQALKKLDEDIATLGKQANGEPSEVTAKRKSLLRDKQAFERSVADCRLLVLRSNDELDRITATRKKLLAAHLLSRGPNVVTVLKDNWSQASIWLGSTATYLLGHSGIEQLSDINVAALLVIAIVAFVLGRWSRRRMRAWAVERQWQETFSHQLGRAFIATFGCYMPYLLVTVAAAAFFFILTRPTPGVPFINVVTYGLPVYVLLLALIHVFLEPIAPAQHFVSLPADISRRLARRLKVLLMLLFVGYLLFSTLLFQTMPRPALLFARSIFAAAVVLNLMWVIWLLGRIPRFADTLWFRLGLDILLVGTLATEWLGYRQLSVFISIVIFGTLFAFGLLVLTARLVGEVFDGIDEGRHPWQMRLRGRLGLKPSDPVPGLLWLRVMIDAALWTVFILGVMRIWGVSESAFQHLQTFFFNGFTVGSLRIIPVRLLLAAASFAILFAFGRWFTTRLERRWLVRMRMDRGAREAMVTVTGYTGTAVAVLVALGIAGLEFKNLAIIAGALSVGIGFGLQNIVNNFVSGLILLFERPVKTGDWVVVGSTEGYVKRIRIRSTQIQTFDRADVIVPNSELISSQVTNWMLYDSQGRVRVPVGVAYGSDTQMVKALLFEVANAHDQVISDGRAPEPQVLFFGFGDSSLNFELRCFIGNIDQRLVVLSDLNYAIDAIFREHGVEIPFPQRDLHVRNWPPAEGPAQKGPQVPALRPGEEGAAGGQLPEG